MTDRDPTRPTDERPRNDRPHRERRSPLLLPILLIGAGVVLLLGRFGLFDWGLALGVLNLWPLLLIALGADILTRGKYRLPIVLGAVVLGAVLFRAPAWTPGFMGGGPAEVHEIAYERGGARAARIELRHGVGHLTLGALPADSDLLAGGEVATGPRESLVREFGVDDGVAVLTLRTRQSGPAFGFDGDGRSWNLALTRDVPVDLDLDAGVGRSILSLRDLTLRSLDLNTGVGEIRVTLPETGGYEGEIDAGVGEVVVRIPSAVEARVEVDSGLGGVDVNGEWTRNGDVRTTPGYANAANDARITLRVDGGVGSIRIDRID